MGWCGARLGICCDMEIAWQCLCPFLPKAGHSGRGYLSSSFTFAPMPVRVIPWEGQDIPHFRLPGCWCSEVLFPLLLPNSGRLFLFGVFLQCTPTFSPLCHTTCRSSTTLPPTFYPATTTSLSTTTLPLHTPSLHSPLSTISLTHSLPGIKSLPLPPGGGTPLFWLHFSFYYLD